MIDHRRGCDVLIREAYSMVQARNASRPTLEFRRRHHTSSIELAQIANIVKPALLITYHRSTSAEDPAQDEDEDVLVGEIRQTYKGRVVAARDLDVF
jgi:ribonuclease BN (tRNA processing enzyme)